MQQFGKKSSWYFALGSPEKTSLCSQFCRENNFSYFKDPKMEDLSKIGTKDAIIEGSLELFREIEKKKQDLSIVLVGKPANKEEKQLCQEYQKIGRLKTSPTYKYQQFRKKMFPNIIFVYGPVASQNKAIALTLANNIGYIYSEVVADSNDYILHIDKCNNYVVNGLFADSKQIRIMSEYFQIRVVHLKYNRVDLPSNNEFFDREFALANFLKDKSYYVPIIGTQGQEKILDDIGEKLCPNLIYVNVSTKEQQAYLQTYLDETNGLLLSLDQIQIINKRKNLHLPDTPQQKILSLSSVFYKDLNRKSLVLSYYPWALHEVIALQKINRKFSLFVDLTDESKYTYNKSYSSQLYFIQTQRYLRPNKKNSLKNELQPKIEYWLVTGAVGSGKTTVAKYISSQFGLKHIQFQPYLASVKEKLIAPEDGEQLPVRKVIEHFRQILTNDKDNTYVIDGLPYAGKDLESWIAAIGAPNVINLQVETPEQIKRSRKKAEADLAAEINEEQSNKAKDSTEKNRVWIENLSNVAPSASIYKIDYNDPQIKVQSSIKKIMRPRIFLVQKNATHAYQNIAIRYGLGFVSLNKIRLRECEKQVKKCKKRDIILCNHGHEKKRIASQDLYWIEKNLGQIRYVGIWQAEDKYQEEEKLVLEKPSVQEKPKPAEGQAGEAVPAQDPPAAEGEGNKKKLDIYDFEWTKPGEYKNLSQWFLKSKKHVTQIENSPQDSFKNFNKVLEKLNENSENNVYERIK